MAALDTLFFDLKINDLTDEQLTSIKKKLSDLGVETNIKIGVDKNKLSSGIKDAIKNDGDPYKINVVIDKAGMSKSIQDALDKAGFNQQNNFSVSDARFSKTQADNQAKAIIAQTKANNEAQKAADAHAISQMKLEAATARTQKAQLALAAAHERAERGIDSHISANVRLGQSMTGLVSISGDLRNQLGMFVSAYTFENLVKNVIEIGGEFEKQKMAMASMLGSLEQADDIFNRMKNLALTSPFNFKDLSNYSRQLTAYGTDYKDLFDTTNRLADISAGLGGDMSRLVLAFSQVKSASFLRGQEMRQFTEFGVSLPEMLAKKYTEAEGKIVTAGDVIERVSKRMVSFNDVKDVLWKSTDKGGKFFGMQDVLAQSTSGMASNLKDAIDTAYYDIANSNSGVIKDTIKDVTSMVSHWKEFGAVLTSGLGIYSAYRLAMAANNMLIGRGTSETLKSVMASKQEEASILRRKALYGELSAEEKALVANSNTLNVSDIRNLALSKEINADALMRMVNSKKLTAAQALQMGTLLDLSVGQRKYLIDLQNVEIELTRATGFWDRYALSVQKATMTTTSKLSSIGSSISSFMSGILTKANVAMAAIFVGMDAYIEYSQKIKQLDDSNTQTIRNAEDSSKNLNEFLSKNPIKPVLEKGNTDEISKMIDAYKEQITSTPFDMSSFITNVDAITDTTQKLEALRIEMESMKGAEESIAKNGNGFLQAEKSNTTWLPNWVMSMDQGITNVLSRLGVIPQSFRNWEKSGDESHKSLTNVFSDLQSSTSDLEEEMSKLTNADIQTGIDKLKDKYKNIKGNLFIIFLTI